LDEAVEIDVEDTPAHVFTAEHLAVIALESGRPKDKARLLQFIEGGALDPIKLEKIIQRHGLTKEWRQFQRQFLES